MLNIPEHVILGYFKFQKIIKNSKIMLTRHGLYPPVLPRHKQAASLQEGLLLLWLQVLSEL